MVGGAYRKLAWEAPIIGMLEHCEICLQEKKMRRNHIVGCRSRGDSEMCCRHTGLFNLKRHHASPPLTPRLT